MTPEPSAEQVSLLWMSVHSLLAENRPGTGVDAAGRFRVEVCDRVVTVAMDEQTAGEEYDLAGEGWSCRLVARKPTFERGRTTCCVCGAALRPHAVRGTVFCSTLCHGVAPKRLNRIEQWEGDPRLFERDLVLLRLAL